MQVRAADVAHTRAMLIGLLLADNHHFVPEALEFPLVSFSIAALVPIDVLAGLIADQADR